MVDLGSYECKGCKVGLTNVFSHLTIEELDKITIQKHCKIFKAGEIIYRQTSHLSGFFV